MLLDEIESMEEKLNQREADRDLQRHDGRQRNCRLSQLQRELEQLREIIDQGEHDRARLREDLCQKEVLLEEKTAEIDRQNKSNRVLRRAMAWQDKAFKDFSA